MHYSEQNVYISVLNCILWDIMQVYYGICEIGLFDNRTKKTILLILSNLLAQYQGIMPSFYADTPQKAPFQYHYLDVRSREISKRRDW